MRCQTSPGGQSIGLYGLRKSGKTSLALAAAHWVVQTWAATYQSDCLAGCAAVDDLKLSAPVHAALHARSRDPDGADVCVDHFLLRLPRA